MTRRKNRSRAQKNEAGWKSFLEAIGGVERLNFGWSRQSGKRWSIQLSEEAKQRRQLRALIHEGVGNRNMS